MLEFFNFEWLISVVVVGVLINLASDYLKPGLDRVIAFFSKRRREMLMERLAELDRAANVLLQDTQEVIHLKLDTLTKAIRSVFLVLLSIVCFSLPSVVSAIFGEFLLQYRPQLYVTAVMISFGSIILGMIILVFAMVYFRESRSARQILHRYEEKRQSRNSEMKVLVNRIMPEQDVVQKVDESNVDKKEKSN